jgi:hypothetical protein
MYSLDKNRQKRIMKSANTDNELSMYGGNNMKKINLSSKAKKSLIITGSALICVGAIAAALSMSGGVAAAEPQSAVASSSPSTSIISVAPIIVEDESQASSTFVPSSGASQSTELTIISKPTSAPPAPSVASGTNITNKSSKPSYSSKPAAKSSSKATTKKTSSTPRAGDIKDGKMYDPEFGWVTIGGTNKETTVSGNWGGGSQIGIMN